MILKPLLLLIVSATTFSLALAFGSNEFSYSRPRAMMTLCDDIRRELGVLITYEDAPYEAGTELTNSVLARNGNKVLAPKWKPITFRLTPSVSGQSSPIHIQQPINDDVFASIADVTTQYNESGNPGHFAAKQEGKYVHIRQTLRMNTGRWETFQPISETTLAWQSERNTCFAVLSDLSQALARARGFSIVMGSVPMNALLKHDCNIRGLNPTVGEVLEEIMKQLETNLATGKVATGYGFSWDLIYDPNWNKYFLSIVLVQERVPGQTPAQIISPQALPKSAEPNSSSVGTRIAHH